VRAETLAPEVFNRLALRLAHSAAAT
jgi:hypothetical protein